MARRDFIYQLRSLPKYLGNLADIGIVRPNNIDNKKLGDTRAPSREDDEYGFLDDSTENSNLPFFDNDYQARIREIRAIKSHPEIERVVHTIANESIITDKFGSFCSLDLDLLRGGPQKYSDEVIEKVESEFSRIYSLWGFSEDNTAWDMFVKFLEEGYLAYEMVVDDIINPTAIIGFNELAPDSIVPIMVDKEDEDGNTRKVKVWRQRVKNAKTPSVSTVRTIPDSLIIFVSYSRSPSANGKMSYVERLKRSFNILRTIEDCMVAWYVMNSQSRIKIIVPVGNKNPSQAKMALTKVKNKYRENVSITSDSGVVTVNGSPRINFSKTLILPSANGQRPEIDGVSFSGPDLGRSDVIDYFSTKFQRDSNLPFSRFDRGNGGGVYIDMSDRDELSNDERDTYLFLNRLRNEFQKVLTKPLKQQMLMSMPELKSDPYFSSAIGMHYHSDRDYQDSISIKKEAKKLEMLEKFERKEDGNRERVYSTKYLYVNKFGIMTEEEWELNVAMKAEERATSGGQQ